MLPYGMGRCTDGMALCFGAQPYSKNEQCGGSRCMLQSHQAEVLH